MRIPVEETTLGLALCGLLACGGTPTDSNLSVTNATSAAGEFPGIEMLEMVTASGRGTCTGAFVTETEVLTAAHCVSGVDTILINGIPTTDMTPHPLWNESNQGSYGYDIAVVRFQQPVAEQVYELSNTIPQSGDTATIVGFGFTDWNTKFDAGEKRKGDTTIEGLDPSSETYMILSSGCNGEVCSTDPNESAVGQGDSGGPLLVNNQIVGVASLGGSDGRRAESLHASLHQDENIKFLNEQIPSLNIDIPVIGGAERSGRSDQDTGDLNGQMPDNRPQDQRQGGQRNSGQGSSRGSSPGGSAGGCQ